MNVELLHHTPLWVAATAIRKCWASEGKSDSYKYCTECFGTEIVADYCAECATTTLDVHLGEKDKELIHRVGNKNKHSSTLEHLVYSFDIDGISRACLQELARHRIASYSVKSTRYTLKELKNIPEIGTDRMYDFLVPIDPNIDFRNLEQLQEVQQVLKAGVSNDYVKYLLPEQYKTSLVMTINARSLQNFLKLRTNKAALWEIQDLAHAMFKALPEEHKYLFEEYIYDPKAVPVEKQLEKAQKQVDTLAKRLFEVQGDLNMGDKFYEDWADEINC